MSNNRNVAGWRPPVFIVSGAQGEGKTTFISKLLTCFEPDHLKMRGIIAPGYFQDGIRFGFSVIDVSTGMMETLCSANPAPGCELHGRYYFRPEGLLFGRQALLYPVPASTDLMIIDEVGRFDVRGDLWGGSIDQLVQQQYSPMIWAVRDEFVEMVTKRWQMIRPVLIKLGSASIEKVSEDILNEIRMYRSTTTQLTL